MPSRRREANAYQTDPVSEFALDDDRWLGVQAFNFTLRIRARDFVTPYIIQSTYIFNLDYSRVGFIESGDSLPPPRLSSVSIR